MLENDLKHPRHIAVHNPKERQRDRPVDSRGRRPGRRPEEGHRGGEAAVVEGRKTESHDGVKDWKERSNALLAISWGGTAKRIGGASPSRGSTMRGEAGTHKTGKHVISPRKGEKVRPRKRSRAPPCSSSSASFSSFFSRCLLPPPYFADVLRLLESLSYPALLLRQPLRLVSRASFGALSFSFSLLPLAFE